MVDRFSGFSFLHLLQSLETRAVTIKLEAWFALFGRPLALRSDGGPQFRGEFGEFCLRLGVEWELASPYNSQSNGLAEAAVKALKRLVLTVPPSNIEDALQECRNTPHTDGISPAFAFLGKHTCGSLPFIEAEMMDFPTRAMPVPVAGRSLSSLTVGAFVWFQVKPVEGWKEGIVTELLGERTYSVRALNGREYAKNRRFLRSRVTGKLQPGPADVSDVLEEPADDEECAPRRSRRHAGQEPELSALSHSRI